MHAVATAHILLDGNPRRRPNKSEQNDPQVIMAPGSDGERERPLRQGMDDAPVPTPKEDAADVRAFLAELRAAGVRDVREHFVALRESERRYREFADLLPEAVFESDPDGRLTYINRAAVRPFGYSLEEVAAGITLEQLVKAPDRRGTATALDLRPSEGSTSVEYVALHKDGSTVPVLVRMGPVVRNDHVVGLRGVIVDLTERKRYEQALRELSVRLTSGIEAERRRVAMRAGEPGAQVVVHEDASESTANAVVVNGACVTMPNEWTWVPRLSVNVGGDTTSLSGGYSRMWQTAYEVFTALLAEGEERYKHLYGSQNSYDYIYYHYWVRNNGGQSCTSDTDCGGKACEGKTCPSGLPCNSSADCGGLLCSGRCNTICSSPGDSTIQCDVAQTWAGAVAHETGHIAHRRPLDGSIFPGDTLSAHAYYTGEGNNVHEAIASLVGVLSRFDPSLAQQSTLQGLWPCATQTTTYQNVNYLSADRNGWRALYDILDTSGDGADDGKSDTIDLTFEDLIDSLITWKTPTLFNLCLPGVNHNRCERILDRYSSSSDPACVTSENCVQGGVCLSHNGRNWCYASETLPLGYFGDPHGQNIWDWLWNIASQKGVSSTAYRNALESCACIKPVDDSWPFDGGYRDD